MLYGSAIWLLVASVVLFAPASAAGPDPRFRDDAAACWSLVEDESDTACVVQYAHVTSLLDSVQLSMQRPPDDVEDVSAGVTSTPGVEPIWNWNQVRLVPMPGPAHYGDERIMREHGIAGNIVLDPDIPLFGYWAMSADVDEFAPAGIDHDPDGSDPGLGVLPCLTVRMTVETGPFPGNGEVLTAGQQTKTLVTGRPLADQGAPPVSRHLCTGDRESEVHIDDVVTFEIEMPPIKTSIMAETGFHVQVEWWNHAPGDPNAQDKVYLQWWNLHSGPEYAPRVVFPTQGLLTADSATLHADDDRLYVEALFNSAFGSYAVDPETIRLQVFTEDRAEVKIGQTDRPILRFATSHDGHFQPVRAIVAWDAEREALPPGPYTLRMGAQDLQGHSAAFAETQLVVIAAVEQSPLGVTPLFGLGLLALLAARRRGT